MRRRRVDVRNDERGAMLLISGFAIIALLATAAIVVDLAAARNDRSVNQVSTDAAATAAAIAMSEGTGVDGCETALGYLEANLGQSLSGANCAGFPTSCSASTPSISTTGTAGGVSATITYPVANGDQLMTPETVGGVTMAITSQDGDRCSRIGVAVSEERDVFFGGFVDVDTQTTSAHSVAVAADSDDHKKIINLLILHRTDCEAISVHGNGAIVVEAVVDPATGDILPGLLAADSDGTTNCGPNGVIDVDGAVAEVRADGPPGCPDELPSGPGHGCGSFEIFADGSPGCVRPACSGSVAPSPTHPSERLTRAQIDWRFNCKLAYPVAYDIEGCPDTATTNPYIDNLVADIGAFGKPPGFQSYTDAGYACTISPKGTVTIPEGNWWIACDMSIKGLLEFEGGNLVFDGAVNLNSSGRLSVNESNGSTYNWTEGAPVDHHESSDGAAFMYFRDGGLSKSAQASVTLHNTMLYLSATSELGMNGGSGSMSFVAPTEGPFENLAMWSESPLEVRFGGSAILDLEGVFFAPFATVSYQGSGAQKQVAAQFISSKLSVGGSGTLVISPLHDRMVVFPSPGGSELIR